MRRRRALDADDRGVAARAAATVFVRTVWSYCVQIQASGDVRRGEQRLERRAVARPARARRAEVSASGGRGSRARAGRRPAPPSVSGADRDVRRPMRRLEEEHDAAGVRDLADLDRARAPTCGRSLSILLAALPRATSSIRSCDSESMISYGVMPALARRGTLVEVDARCRCRRARPSRRSTRSARRRPCPGCRRSASVCIELEARLEEELLGERIADLHRRAASASPRRRRTPPRPWWRRGCRRARSWSRRRGPDCRRRSRGRGRSRSRRHDPEVEDVDEDVAVVAAVERRLAADGRDADAVAVAADAAHDAVDEVASCAARRGSPKRSESSDAIGRAPIVKMSRRMPPTPVAAPWYGSMKHGWLCDSILNAATQPSPMSTTPAFSPGPLDHVRALGRELAQVHAGGLVGAVLAPHGGEDAELGLGSARGRGSRGCARTPPR